MSRIDRLICHVMPKAFLMALTADGRLVEMLLFAGAVYFVLCSAASWGVRVLRRRALA